jgi:hypothetical protein
MEKSNSSRGTLSNNSKLRIQNSTLTLFPELHLSGEISDEIVVEPYHHLVCEDDVTFVPGSRLEIQPNAVVRIAPGADLTIMGSFKAQGEEDNMFWVTSNDGFAEDSKLKMKNVKSKMKKPVISSEVEKSHNFTSSILDRRSIDEGGLNFTFNRDSDLELYNSMQLSPLATVEDDLIEWGKWDWGNTCLLNKVNNVTMQNGIFRNGNCGYYVLLESEVLNTTLCYNLICLRIMDNSKGGMFIEKCENGKISRNILVECSSGLLVKDRYMQKINNNYFWGNQTGISLFHYLGIIENNEMYDEEIDVKFTGNMEPDEENQIQIQFNNFNAPTGIKNYLFLTYAYQYYSGININYNNFFDNLIFFRYHSRMINEGIDATHNYFGGLIDIESIMSKIIDSWEQSNIEVNVEPWSTNIVTEAGIQNE